MNESTDRQSLEERVRSALADDVAEMLQVEGTDIEFLDIDSGVVRVRLHGSCTGCPSAVQTIIFGIEQELRKRVPEVEYLEVIP